MGKRQEAALMTKRKIIDAMKVLLSEKSAAEINIEDIVEMAGVAKGSFYTYFKRKEDAISLIAFEKYDVIKENVLNSNNTVLENITVYLTESTKVVEKNSLNVAQNWMKSVTTPLGDETGGLDKYNYDSNIIFAILQRAINNDELIAETPVESITQTILNYYYGSIAVWCITKGQSKFLEDMQDFCKIILSGIIEKYRK